MVRERIVLGRVAVIQGWGYGDPGPAFQWGIYSWDLNRWIGKARRWVKHKNARTFASEKEAHLHLKKIQDKKLTEAQLAALVVEGW